MYIRFTNLQFYKIIICFFPLLIISQRVFAENEIERLKQDILKLEKIANPFVQIFQKVSTLVSPSVVSIVAENESETFTDPHDSYPTPFFRPGEQDKKRPDFSRPSFGSGIVVKKTGYIIT